MRNKKWIIVAFLIFMVIQTMVAGCSKRDESTQEKIKPENTPQGFEGVITLWDFPKWANSKGNRFYWIEDMIEGFEKKHPGVFIELRKLTWEDGPFELQAAISSGTQPDIACISGNINFSWYETIEPLDEYLSSQDVADFHKGALEVVKHNGRIWGLPFYMTTHIMFLNLGIFKERKVEPPKDGIWTWEEFIAKLKKLTYDRNKDGRNDVYGFHSFIKEGYYNLWGIVMSDGACPLSSDLNSFTFHYPEAIDGLKKLSSLVNVYKVTHPDFGKATPEEAWTAFAAERKVAVYPAGSWAVKALLEKQKEGEGFEFDVAYYPVGKLGMPNIIHPGVASYVVFKQKDEKKRKLCIEFVKEITSTEQQKNLHLYGVFPARKSTGNIYINSPYMKRIQQNLEYTMPPPGHPRWREIEAIVQEEIRRVLLGEKEPEGAMNDAKKRIDIILGSGHKVD